MKRGISGFGVIVLIIILLIIGYVAYQIGRVHFTYRTISEHVETALRTGATVNDYEIVDLLVRAAEEAKIELDPDSIFIDHGIPDSFRIYVAYDDSSDIFGFFYYKRHLIIDKIESLKVLD
ncbi:hypothetical protein AMJ87_07065 [candidate division WOR_3 bacterium SM23_60]|uniref:DUF4845 domain-containing protein n=1 Tax=candidate division WOR_3 bacterium SM23_60 TaxID=1703780 RepID=A0A0S8GIA8_UNCW3|nr:MAG: hypothetical protein AMJ87_07065 [candidate division WOR_3 bacterium SM23_60]